MNKFEAMYLIGGIVLGAGMGILGSRKYFEKKYQAIEEKHVRELEDYFHRTDEYARQVEDDVKGLEENPVGGATQKIKGIERFSEDEREKIRQKLKENHRLTTDYAAMYDPKTGEKKYKNKEDFLEDEDPAESESPEDDDDGEMEKVHEHHQATKNRKPRIISADAVGDVPAYFDNKNLYFYAWDEVLVDDEDQVVDDPGLLIGDALTKYNFIDNDQMLMFVLNESQSTLYEIAKVKGAWNDGEYEVED